MRDGDIYRWRYKPEIEKANGGRGEWGAYHCKSQMAVVHGGLLIDTFWGDMSSDSAVDPDRVEITLLGNKNDMRELNDQEDFYDPDDLIIMRHSNNSRAKTLVKPDATRSPDMIRKVLNQKRGDAERELMSAARELERLALAKDKLERGEIADLYI